MPFHVLKTHKQHTATGPGQEVDPESNRDQWPTAFGTAIARLFNSLSTLASCLTVTGFTALSSLSFAQDTPHLLVFTNNSGQKTPYFVYQGQKQFIGSDCRDRKPGLDPFARPSLQVRTTSDWSTGANQPPLGGPDRDGSAKLSCEQMAAFATSESGNSSDTAKLMLYRTSENQTSVYFSYQNAKQWIGNHPGSGVLCRAELERLLKYDYLDTATSWPQANQIGGPDRSNSEKLSCDRMVALAASDSDAGSSTAKLLRYRNSANTVSIFFSYQNSKQWIGSNQSDGLSCRFRLEELLRNQFLEDTSDWQRANEIGGPNRTEPLGCNTMLAIAMGVTAETPEDRSDPEPDAPGIDLDSPTAPGGEVDRASPFGINLTAETYWSSAWTFVDIMHKATPWTANANTGSLELDANGWVKRLKSEQTANLNVYRNVSGNYPAGEYTVLYDGEGTLEYGRGASLVAGSRRTGSERIAVNPDEGRVDITLTSTNPSNHLRGLRVIMPDGSCQDDKARFCRTDSQCGDAGRCLPFTETWRERIFHPNFLRNLNKFPIIRFMDWGAVNHIRTSDFKDPREDPVVPSKRTWNNRIQPDHHPWQAWFQAGREVPYEVMIRLANDINAHAWMTVPHGVDDHYVRELARLVRNRLGSRQTVYLELGNEMWNYAFKQGSFLSDSRSSIGPMEATLDRSIEIFKIWQQEFGGTSRLVRVIAPQAGWPDAGRQLMQRAKDKGLLSYIDAIAIAPYFGHEWACDKNDQFADKTVDQIIGEIGNGGMRPAIDRMKAYGAIADQYGKRLIAYEGGQHLALLGRNAAAESCANGAVNKDTPEWAAKVYELNRHPGMRRIYNNYLQEWRRAGGEEFVFYSYTGLWNNSGAWGFFESNRSGVAANSPKFQGAMDFRQFNPKWW